ncbi:prolyl hydroxylase family protein [Alteraurantiacibacter aquimixticola]|uniref:2OG-Fe(II) oxygenase n=1 Tax=Alteraurantiacibacter aquimixticola TaxID=2489173 RepID=A0A4T3F1K3_9SPHN|nr:2OG-Fe(II) oxygenase [Alteraurantiacibacter aquimixticola]TIX51075.1 2OG-Fe(II) oxygenase [Alteraurantiacibacter aquimixticola]
MSRFTFSYDAPRAAPSGLVDPVNDPAKLAAVGAAVSSRLSGKPGIVAHGGTKADLFTIPGFRDAKECARLVSVIDSRIGPSELFEGTEVDGFRTSSTHHFDEGDPDVVSLQRAIADALGIPVAHAEVMQGQRYLPGQQYKHHFDYFTPGQPYWQQERRRGGQRSWTAMLCLNEPEAGGATDFHKLGVAIPPKTGTLVVWNNMDAGGHPNPATLHAGMPVDAGAKYVITQWFRQDEWSLHLR